MTITEGSTLIATYLVAGAIDHRTAVRAQAAIREQRYYGHRMSGRDRERVLTLRFGIVDTMGPVTALLQRVAA